MVMIRQITERTDQAVLPDLDILRCVKHRETIDICPVADHQTRAFAARAYGQKYDVVIQRDAVTDHDVPRVPRHLNPADPAVPANMRAEKSQTHDAQPHGN